MIWSVGSCFNVYHYEYSPPAGTEWWRVEPFGIEYLEAFNGVFAITTSNVWVVGTNGHIANFNGFSWSMSEDVPTTANLNAIWANGPEDIWAFGENGTALRYSVAED